MQTIVAVARALKAFYLVSLVTGVLVLLIPPLWIHVGERFGGEGTVLRGLLALALIAALMEHSRSSALGRRIAFVAQRVLGINPTFQRIEAMKILVRGLRSDKDEVVATAYKELKNLSGEDLGTDPETWQRWISDSERITAKGDQIPPQP